MVTQNIGAKTRGRGGSPSRPPRRTNHAAFFSLLIGSLRKNGRLGDPALPSLSSNFFHVKHFHPKSLESARPVGFLRARAAQWIAGGIFIVRPFRRVAGGGITRR
jgi:hypothetical protein